MLINHVRLPKPGLRTIRPRLSRGTASRRTSSPTEIAFSGGFTVIASARGGATVTRSRPWLPSQVAVMRADPGATAVATVFLILVCVVLIVFLVAAKGGGGNFGGGGGGSDGPPYQIRIRFDPQGRVVDISPPHPVGP